MKIIKLFLTLIMMLAITSFAMAEDVFYEDNTCRGDFSDVDVTNFFCLEIEKMYELGVTTGCGGGNYCPDNYVTRGQMAAFIMRALNLLTNGVETFELTNSSYPTLRLSPTSLPYGLVDTSYNEVVVMTAGGGTPTYVFECSIVEAVAGIAAGVSFEDGLTGTCTISGTPTATGRVTVILKATDSTANIDQRLISFDVYDTVVQTYTLTVNKSGGGTGTVTSSPAGVNCGADCSEVYDEGTSVALTANADADSTFSGWSGGGCSGTGQCVVTINSDTTVTAAFTVNTGISYIEIMEGGSGVLDYQSIPANRGQAFYKFVVPAGGCADISIGLAGRNTANCNQFVTDTDFGTTSDALTAYIGEFDTIGYFVRVFGPPYWHYFTTSADSESVWILSPTASEYYIEVVNEAAFDGSFRIEWYCIQ